MSLWETVKEALRLRDLDRQAGASEAQQASQLEQIIRRVWPFTREWKYVCRSCDDTGLVMKICRAGDRCNGISTRTDGPKETPGKYRRLCTRDTEGTYTHDYGEPCFCSAGSRFRSAPPSEFDPVAVAAKTPKKQPTRWGR